MTGFSPAGLLAATAQVNNDFALALYHDFLQTLNRQAPDAVQTADFLQKFPAERKRINNWVAHHTRNRISNIIPKLPPELAHRMRLILVNAIYFKGHWAEPFLESHTKPRDFFPGQERKNQVPMMHAARLRKGRYAAFQRDDSFFDTPRRIDRDQTAGLCPETPGFAFLELPYQGNRLAMVVLAPLSPDGLGALKSRLTPAHLTGWLGQLVQRDVEVYLPRFRLETAYRLHETLTALGMKRTFIDPSLPNSADFSAMSASPDPNHRLSGLATVVNLLTIPAPQGQPRRELTRPPVKFLAPAQRQTLQLFRRIMDRHLPNTTQACRFRGRPNTVESTRTQYSIRLSARIPCEKPNDAPNRYPNRPASATPVPAPGPAPRSDKD